ncbi:MAG: phosphate transport system permease protein [Flavobacteriales bacterium]|jgi:phosphate transport system permease protein|tara:strand:+ start:1367 stop:2239 length:873 start_codon:yes stop_codon:yes gene_type:complete
MKVKEMIIEKLLFLCASISVLITVGIILVLLLDTFEFFQEVSFVDFITDKKWTPMFKDKHFGIGSLLAGTFLTTVIAVGVAIPIGLSIAIYLNEFAPKGFRKRIKPALELLAAVPTIVYGFFALTVVTPFLKQFIDIDSFNALSAGLVMGIMIIPYISSISEDALYAVPKSLREAAYGMGTTRLQTAFKVTIPAASSGIIVSIILAISRAIGETMIVAIAAGQKPTLTLDPTETIATITSFIVQVTTGDVEHGSIEYKSLFAAGITLFLFTFMLNNISYFIKKKYQEKYD